jgi:hypothetical protein
VLGSEIPNTPAGATGPSYLFQSIEAGEENDRFRTVIVSDPADGFLLEFPDTSFVFSGAPDGTYTFVRQIFKNDVAVTPNLTATMTVGEAITETRSPQVTNSVVAISVPGAVDATITENRSSQATSASARFPFEFPDGAKIIYVKRQN